MYFLIKKGSEFKSQTDKKSNLAIQRCTDNKFTIKINWYLFEIDFRTKFPKQFRVISK